MGNLIKTSLVLVSSNLCVARSTMIFNCVDVGHNIYVLFSITYDFTESFFNFKILQTLFSYISPKVSFLYVEINFKSNRTLFKMKMVNLGTLVVQRVPPMNARGNATLD